MNKNLDSDDYTISSFTIQISHPLDRDRDSLGEEIAKAIDSNEDLHTMMITSECTLYHHFQK
jgi:hypothetical protein